MILLNFLKKVSLSNKTLDHRFHSSINKLLIYYFSFFSGYLSRRSQSTTPSLFSDLKKSLKTHGSIVHNECIQNSQNNHEELLIYINELKKKTEMYSRNIQQDYDSFIKDMIKKQNEIQEEMKKNTEIKNAIQQKINKSLIG